jgi:hypothetical protein
MQFAAALVEHLVVGLLAVLWLLPVANQFTLVPDVKISDHKEILIALGLPVAYVVGMYVDVIASWLSSRIKKLLYVKGAEKARFLGNLLPEKGGDSYKRTAVILKLAPDEAARYMLQLSSRVKIARGTYLNFLIAAAVHLFVPASKYSVSPLLLFGMTTLGVVIWLRLDLLTDNFKTHWD